MERPRALRNRVFDRLFEAAEIAKFNRKELGEYWESLKNFRDWYSVMKTQLNKGREEGREEERIKNVRKLKELGVSSDIIAQATGLSEEEIKTL